MSMENKKLEPLNHKHVLIYDRIWWIQGQRALILQQYHPSLEIISFHDFVTYVKQKGAKNINQEYEVISTLGLWTAERLIRLNVKVDSAVAGSYSYLAKNQNTFKEWSEEIRPNYKYIAQVLKKIDRIGAVNRKLASTIQQYCPGKTVTYMKSFVETDKFKPLGIQKEKTSPFTIGWVGNAEKSSKNYNTLYKEIANHFKDDPRVQFKEATKQERIDREDMPAFYNTLDLMLITGANEGLPNPAMEAYSCGVPVLATNIGIIKEWASPRAKSLVLDSDDPQLFIQKIKDVMINRTDLQNMKSEIRENIESHWQADHNIGIWLSTLFGIGGERK